MNRRNTAVAAVAVLSAATLALTGCAKPNTTPTEVQAPDQLPLVGWKEVPADQVQQGGVLKLARASSGTDEGNWNPNTSQGANVEVNAILDPLQGSPYRATKEGGVEVNPNYATSIEMTSESPQTIDVKLNDKAVWEDGSPLTAKDYEATFATLSGKSKDFNLASSAGYSEISNFTVKGDYEFEFSFDTPYADWQNLLIAPAVPKDIASDAKKWNTGYVSKPLPSSGPFVMSKIDNDAKVFTETVNPKWWGDKPKLDTITFTSIPDQGVQAQSFANNELNAVDALDVDTLRSAKAKKDAVSLSSGGTTYSHLTFNGLQAPFDDANVRKAVAMSIDRMQVAKTSNEPLGVKATTDGNWIFMPGQKGYVDTVGEKLPFDYKAAGKLLEQSGWTHADKKWTKDGQELTFTISVPQGTKSNELRAQQIQASLAKNDIAVKLEQVPGEKYFENIMGGKYEAVTFGWQGTLFPISTSESLVYPAGKPGGDGQNYSYVTDESLGDLFKKANSELDSAKRLELANQINDVIAGFVPFVPIFPYPNITVVDGNLANFGPATFMTPDWTKVGFKK